MKNIFIASILASLFSDSALAQIGEPVFGGQGCTGSKSIVPSPEKPNEYRLGLQVALAKMNSPSLQRKACTVRIPVKVSATEKVVISEVRQDVKLTAGKNVSVKTSLELFFAGKKSDPLTAEAKGLNQNERVNKSLSSPGVVSESDCGKEAIISGNVSGSIVGAGRGTAETSPVLLNIQIVSCQ